MLTTACAAIVGFVVGWLHCGPMRRARSKTAIAIQLATRRVESDGFGYDR